MGRVLSVSGKRGDGTYWKYVRGRERASGSRSLGNGAGCKTRAGRAQEGP